MKARVTGGRGRGRELPIKIHGALRWLLAHGTPGELGTLCWCVCEGMSGGDWTGDCVKTISPQRTGTTRQLRPKQNPKVEEGQSPLRLTRDGPPSLASDSRVPSTWASSLRSNCTCCSLDPSACRWQITGLHGFHDPVSQFIQCASIPSHLALLLCRAVTNISTSQLGTSKRLTQRVGTECPDVPVGVGRW